MSRYDISIHEDVAKWIACLRVNSTRWPVTVAAKLRLIGVLADGDGRVKLTPGKLRAAENRIFNRLEHQQDDTTFLGKLYRDGVPTPRLYLAQQVRVLFVFREPSMGHDPYAVDMRREVRDKYFRPVGRDGTRQDRRPTCWWNAKAGMFAHAVAAALEGEASTSAFDRFHQGGWNHSVVNRYAYIQIKKVGGGGTSKAKEICAHAANYAEALKRQVDLYRPHLVLGGGIGKSSPARLLAEHVLPEGRKRSAGTSGATWWEFPDRSYPRALVQLWHPARRGSTKELYNDVWSSVREVAGKLGLSA